MAVYNMTLEMAQEYYKNMAKLEGSKSIFRIDDIEVSPEEFINKCPGRKYKACGKELSTLFLTNKLKYIQFRGLLNE